MNTRSEHQEKSLTAGNHGENLYACPMHPEIKSDMPGKCRLCGMVLVRNQISDIRYPKSDKHAGHSLEMFIKKFWLSLALTLPVVFVSDVVQEFFGFSVDKNVSQIVSLILCSVVFFYGGSIFIKGAISELKSKLPGMMSLIALAISAAYIFSVFAVLLKSGESLF